ncbi:MAG: 4-hydroxy-3-methylbut-2-enyl diphosphate reductase [Deltaproteobacteria bacterium]|nr:4-hydroxy-3-methylbut-2-enyl diphosphate reductase [Deltaproteobacteria bacterium]
MKLLLVKPRGFCAGVVRAIDIVDIALENYGTPLYVRKEIVHNQSVVSQFREKGVVFIDELDEAPKGSVVIFSAHGVSPEVRQQALKKNLHVIDATCPLVTKVHSEVHKYEKQGYSILLIGHADHDEVEGTMGEAPEIMQLVETEDDAQTVQVPDPTKVVVLTQTTLSVDETKGLVEILTSRFPELTRPPKGDICYATQNRQDAVKHLATMDMDLLLVVGSKNSSNSARLCEVARSYHIESHLIDNVEEINPAWIENKKVVGLSAGASAPEYLVQEVVTFLQAQGATAEEVETIEEDVHFALPKELTQSRPLPQA